MRDGERGRDVRLRGWGGFDGAGVDPYAPDANVFHELERSAYALWISGHDAGEHCDCLRAEQGGVSRSLDFDVSSWKNWFC